MTIENPLLMIMNMIIDVTGMPITFALLATELFFTWFNLKIVRQTIRIVNGF